MLRGLFACALAMVVLPGLVVYRLAADTRFDASPAPVTFYKNVAPIVYNRCAPCHREGGPGPFPLLTYNDVRKHASQIVSVTKRRFMPPWLPEPGYGDFQNERRLSDEQIRTIERWVQQGAPAGLAADAPPAPKFVSGWQLGKPDMIIESPTAYHLAAEGPDQYWNFVLTPNLPGPRWIKAIEIRPGNIRAVHHANMYIDVHIDASRAAAAGASRGFPGMDLTNAPVAFNPDSDSYFLFWKPGDTTWVEPTGMAWKAEPGANLLLNVHMRPTGKPEVVQPSVGLYFTSDPGTIHPMLLPLERDGALNIPPGDADFKVSDDFVTPVDLNVLAIYPHAHYLGHVLEGYATLPGGARKWLIRIPDWDQSWQASYHYKAPVFLPKGTVISMRYSYDNSAANVRNPHQPPRRVRDGNQTTDEMAHLSLQVLLTGPEADRPQLQAAIMQHRLDKYPGDFTAQLNLGIYMLQQKRFGDAVRYLRGAVAAQPSQPLALASLGRALLAQGDANDATGFLERALQVNPHYTNARADLAGAYILEHRWEQSADEFRQVLADRPGDQAAQHQLGGVLRLLGYQSATNRNLEQAVGYWRESEHLGQDDAEMHNDLGATLAQLGRPREAIPEFEAALRVNPNLGAARRNLEAARAQMAKH